MIVENRNIIWCQNFKFSEHATPSFHLCREINISNSFKYAFIFKMFGLATEGCIRRVCTETKIANEPIQTEKKIYVKHNRKISNYKLTAGTKNAGESN